MTEDDVMEGVSERLDAVMVEGFSRTVKSWFAYATPSAQANPLSLARLTGPAGAWVSSR
ncbi:hypothetical protein LNP05_29880 [Klebsiella pneumoniae subsp. pneumoniae]|nr:hypothetical protein [Klebsiella pneumoniae subsp. pneumoniae]